jgi:hypothetical protein
MKRQHLIEAQEKFTPKLAEDFRKNGAIRLSAKNIQIIDCRFDNAEIIAAAQHWYPTNYRDDLKTDQALSAWERGVQVCLTAEPTDASAFHLEDEQAFQDTLSKVNLLEFQEEPKEFAFYYKGMPFYPLREPYPFVLPGYPMENTLYFRCLLLHYKQILEANEFLELQALPPEPELLAKLAQRYRGMLEKRAQKIYETWGNALNGKEVYFWGHGAAWRHFRHYFAGTKPRCILVDMENLNEKESRADGIALRHPRDLLREGAQALPSVMFARQEFADVWSKAVCSRYSSLISGKLMLCRLERYFLTSQ